MLNQLAIYLLFISTVFAGDPPVIKGTTKVARTSKILPEAELRIVEVDKIIGVKVLEEHDIKTIKSSKKGKFEFVGEYNKYYRIYCSHPSYLNMFFDVDTRIAKGKKEPEVEKGIDIDVYFFSKEDNQIMSLDMLEKFPFDVFRYNSSSETFSFDPIIRSQVKAGTFRDKLWEKEEKRLEAIKKAEEEKRRNAEIEELRNKLYTISAKVYLKGNGTLYLPKAQITLYTENPATNPNATKLNTFTANAFGKVIFKGIKIDQTYYAVLNDVDENNYKYFKLMGKNNVPLSNDEPQLISNSGLKSSVISFKADKNFIEQFQTFSTGITIGGNILVGETERSPLGGVKVYLRDETNKILQTTKTNSFGGFAFTNINPEMKYLITLEETDPALVANKKVYIVDKSGQTVFSSIANEKGEFTFTILPTDQTSLRLLEVDDEDLSISLKGKILIDPVVKTPLKNSKLFLFDGNGNPLKSTTTDENGNFIFENFSPDGSYLLSLDENDPELKTITKVYLENSYGQLLSEIKRDQLNKFTFRILPSDYTNLLEIEVKDPWLSVLKTNSVGTTIAEPIYFKSGDHRILKEAAFVLDKVATVMKASPKLVIEVSSHTDATGSDEFNLELSKKRAKAAVDYLVKKGISINRLKPVGYGETRLKNNCGNNVKCTEAEHAQNRRIEFKILDQ